MTYQDFITNLKPRQIFVFGSNLSGFHGAGAAGFASFGVTGNRWREFDYASKPNGWQGRWNVKGIGEGLQQGTKGWSYALPTVTHAGAKRSISLRQIAKNIAQLYIVATRNPTWEFLIAFNSQTRTLNGYTMRELAQLFSSPIPNNISFEKGFAILVKN